MPPAAWQAKHTDPEGLSPGTPISCATLHAIIPARCCVLRQLVSERQRTIQGSRGQGGEFPTCTDRCDQGVALREALAEGVAPEGWKGEGPGGRFLPLRPRWLKPRR